VAGERSRALEARDSRDFSIFVKNKGTDSKPWKWMIYSAGRKSPMVRSRENFASIAGAYKAGKEALKEFLEQPERPRDRNY